MGEFPYAQKDTTTLPPKQFLYRQAICAMVYFGA